MTSGFAKADCGRPGGPVVLVTGSSGVVGGAVAAMAETTGWVVRGVDMASGPRTQLVGDLRDPRPRRRVSGSAQGPLPDYGGGTGRRLVADATKSRQLGIRSHRGAGACHERNRRGLAQGGVSLD